MIMLTALFAGIYMNSLAQSREFSVSPLRYAGIHSLSNTPGESDAYLLLQTASGGNWNIDLVDTSLNQIRSTSIEAPAYSFFNQLCHNGEYTLMSFVVNAFSTSVTYIVLDGNGQEVARTTRTDVPNLRRGEQFFPSVYPHPTQGFIIIQSTGKTRSAGYVAEHVDEHLNTLWSKEFSLSNAQVHAYDVFSSHDRLYILEATERRGKTQNARLQCIDLNDYTHLYTMDLTDSNNSFFPTALLPMQDGSIALAGTYFKGERISGRNNQGIFFFYVDVDGNTAGMDLHTWSELRSTLRTSVPDWFFKVMPDVYIHAIEPNMDGSFTAIAELYRYSGEVRREDDDGKREQYHRIRMLDFMLFSFDVDGRILQTERIERPHMVLKLDSEFSGGSESLAHNAGQGPLRRARAMKKAGAFTYRFHNKTDDRFNLAFMSYENKTHYAYMMDLRHGNDAQKTDLRHAKPAFISYLQIIDLCTNQSGFGFILSELNTRSFDDSEVYWRGILPGKQGNMLTYEFMPLNGKLQLNVVSFEKSLPQTSNP